MVAAAAGAIRGEPTTLSLALWHGVSPVLLLSAVTVAAGAALYIGGARERFERAAIALTPLARLSPTRAYQSALALLAAVASGQTRLLQSGWLRAYLLIILLTLRGRRA